MITGYIIHSVKKPPRVPFLLNIILWLLSIGILFSLIFGVWEGQLSIITTAFYVSIGHTGKKTKKYLSTKYEIIKLINISQSFFLSIVLIFLF